MNRVTFAIYSNHVAERPSTMTRVAHIVVGLIAMLRVCILALVPQA